MRWSNQKFFLSFFAILPLFVPLSYQPTDPKTAWVKRVVDGDTLLLANGERVWLIDIGTLELHESKKLYRDAKRIGKGIKTIRTLGRKASAFTRE